MGISVEKKDQSYSAQFPVVNGGELGDGLDITVLGGNWIKKNVSTLVAGTSLSLTPSALNYIYINWADNTIKSNTVGYPLDSLELYAWTTDDSDVVSKIDKRGTLRSSAHTDHVSMATDNVSHNTVTPKVLGRALIDGQRYVAGTTARIICMAKKTGGGSGYVRVYDYLGAQELALIEVTESSPAVKDADLTSFPTGAVMCLEFQLYTDGTGSITASGAALEVQ